MTRRIDETVDTGDVPPPREQTIDSGDVVERPSEPTFDRKSMPTPSVREQTIDSGDIAPATERTGALASPPLVSPLALAAIRSAMDLAVVDRDHYQLLAEYARGGLGRIVRARDRRTNRIVAIKEMLRGATKDDAARRFAREALITANLQHPAIVPVYELGRWPTGEPFYAMKLVVGRSFKDVIADCKTLDERLARLPIVVAIAEALAYAHARKIVHRDLKPANVLVGEFGETVVIDWGLAKVIGEPEGPGIEPVVVPDEIAPMHTVVGAVMGTPQFMPPEQARGEATDERADVYQIGAMLYQLIAGKAPYDGMGAKTGRDLVKLVATDPPPALAAREPGTPPDLVTIVAKAMARDPGDRYANANELADELRRFTTGQLVRAHHYDRRTLVLRWLKKRRAPLTVAAVLVAILAAVAIYSVHEIVGERDRAEGELALALYEKGRAAEDTHELARAAMYYAAARRHHDDEASAWAAGLAEARAVIPHVRHLGHAGWVHALAISPDGTRVASVDETGELRVWSPDDAHLIASRKFPRALYAVAWLPGGGGLVVAGDDGGITRLDDTLATQTVLRGHAGRVWSLAFTRDRQQRVLLASAGEDKTVRVWGITDPSFTRVLTGHMQRVYSVAWSSDGTRLASGSDDRTVRVWNVATGEGTVRGSHKAGGIRVVAFTPRDDRIVSAGWDHEVRVWTGTDVQPELWVDSHIVHAAAITAEHDILVTGGEFDAIHAWDLSTHQLITSLESTDGPTTAIALSGRWLVTAGKGAPVVWDASAFSRLAAVGHHAEVNSLAFTADGKRFASGGNDHTLRVWDLATAQELRRVSTGTLDCADGVAVLDLSTIVSTCDDGTLRRWNDDGTQVVVQTGEWMRMTSLSPDGTTLAAGHVLGNLVLADARTSAIITRKQLHAHHIYGVQYAPDGRLVTASLDDHVRVWRGLDLQMEQDIVAHTDDGVLAAALAPDGNLLAIGTQDGALDVWDTRDARWRVRDLGAHQLGTVWKLVYAPDGQHVYTASGDGVVRIWDTHTWAPELLDAQEGPAYALAVSPDGKTLVAGYGSGAIAIWDLATKHIAVRIGGRTRDRGSCAELATQTWTDATHRAVVERACAASARDYFDALAARTHQRLDSEVDVRWDW